MTRPIVKFKEFISHKTAKSRGCKQCCADLSKKKHIKTDYPHGRGQYQVKCHKCGASNWYDIEIDKIVTHTITGDKHTILNPELFK